MRTLHVAALVAALPALLHPLPASACGGCFHPEDETIPSVVTDHRMAIAITKTQTILWDQVRYAGDPKEFAWVLPVRPGTRVELGQDRFLEALDVLSAPTIRAPQVTCGGSPGAGGGASGGCGFGMESTAGSLGGPNAYDPGGTFDGGVDDPGDGVEVVDQRVVGPYVAVTIRASDGGAIAPWLRTNGFAIPKAVEPVLASYVSQSMDFLALRLRPDVGTRAMRPVRVVMPGADPRLPLRMVVAGIGAEVGLRLFVLAEGRYEPTSFDTRLVETTRLAWDPRANRSNYTELFQEAAQNGGRGAWVLESSTPDVEGALQRLYLGRCAVAPPVTRPCSPAPADADADSGSGAGADSDAYPS
jgi:hypothetical protein